MCKIIFHCVHDTGRGSGSRSVAYGCGSHIVATATQNSADESTCCNKTLSGCFFRSSVSVEKRIVAFLPTLPELPAANRFARSLALAKTNVTYRSDASSASLGAMKFSYSATSSATKAALTTIFASNTGADIFFRVVLRSEKNLCMKWLDALSCWSTVLPGLAVDTAAAAAAVNHGAGAATFTTSDSDPLHQFLACGTFDDETQTFSVAHTHLHAFTALLCRNGAPQSLLHMLSQIAREHNRVESPLRLRVCRDALNDAWARICATLFAQRWALNVRSVLRCADTQLGLEYCGRDSEESLLLGGAYIVQLRRAIYDEPNTEASKAAFDEFSLVAFQILWTFAALSRLGLHILPASSHIDEIFDTILIERDRSDHFGRETASENAYFMRDGGSLATADGVFAVPVRRAFATLRYEPDATPRFAHRQYLRDGRVVDVKETEADTAHYIANEQSVRCGTYLALMARLLRRYVFRQTVAGVQREIAPPDRDFLSLFRALHETQFAVNNSVEAFLNSAFAKSFWRVFKPSERSGVIATLGDPNGVLTLISLPEPLLGSAVVLPQQASSLWTSGDRSNLMQLAPPLPVRTYRTNWCGFENIENNCFLNSVLFMLMCPTSKNNSFANIVAAGAAQPAPSADDVEFVRNIRGRITASTDTERARRVLARFFAQSLHAAFTLSNRSDWPPQQATQVNAQIYAHCKKLLPLLDIWSLAKRNVCLTASVGEFQDLDECLLLLCSLLQFEYCCVSTICVMEEFRSLPFADGDDDDNGRRVCDLESRSLSEPSNPLRLQVRSSLEPPLLRLPVDWATRETRGVHSTGDTTAAVEFQSLCTTSLQEFSTSPAPTRRAAVEHVSATRFYGKRHLWSRGKQLLVVYLPRRNSLATVQRQAVQFPPDERLLVGGESMRIASLVLWGNSHYTSLVRDDNRWWHVNDMAPVGYRCVDCGETLAAALAVLDQRRQFVTAVACVADGGEATTRASEESAATAFDAPAIERQVCVEIQKLSVLCDTMQSKAVVLHKEAESGFCSVQTALEQFNTSVTALPRRFLFGHDSPGADFHYANAWYTVGHQMPLQKSPFSLISAHGLRPGHGPNSEFCLPDADLEQEEARIAVASTLFCTDMLPSMRRRAEQTCTALAQLRNDGGRLGNGPVDSATIDVCLDVLQMQHLGHTPRQFIAAGGARNLALDWFDPSGKQQRFNATCWALPATLYTALISATGGGDSGSGSGLIETKHHMLRRKNRRPVFLSAASDIVIPVCSAQRHWTLVHVQPLLRKMSYYDARGGDGAEQCRILARYLAQSTDGGDAEWIVSRQPLQPQLATSDSGLLLLHLCRLIYLAQVGELPTSIEALDETRRYFAENLEHVGLLEPL